MAFNGATHDKHITGKTHSRTHLPYHLPPPKQYIIFDMEVRKKQYFLRPPKLRFLVSSLKASMRRNPTHHDSSSNLFSKLSRSSFLRGVHWTGVCVIVVQTFEVTTTILHGNLSYGS